MVLADHPLSPGAFAAISAPTVGRCVAYLHYGCIDFNTEMLDAIRCPTGRCRGWLRNATHGRSESQSRMFP
jgi:hypothetical protein